ncbi:MAG: hypothetical protein ALECFALPRED_000757 [Alectoria fallacina]|uniref:Rhodopsin domain-containing protein n=1 Tax=Alectoria fallacina TaxID=1903189 RepID=A0A8H3JA59_9LECA|nr:MAG: hypothetical protein ALECFALPRED_000757 [Alectoria fallacina]
MLGLIFSSSVQLVVFGMAGAILAGTAVKSLGYPTPEQDPATELTTTSYRATVARKIYFIVNLMQIVALSFIKSSCVLFYRRVFRTGVSKAIDRSLLALLAIIVLWGVAFFITFLSLCGSHVDYAWSTVANELKCASTTMADQALSISDVITDLMILIFPMPLVTIIDIYRTESY